LAAAVVFAACSSQRNAAKADSGAGGATGFDETGGTEQRGSGGVVKTVSHDAGSDVYASHRFSIVFDYRFDTAGFFGAKQRASLEAAAALWSAVIRADFPAVPAGTTLQLRNPENRDQYVSVDAIERPIDDVLVFVGTSKAILPSYGRSSPAAGAQTSDATLAESLAHRINGRPFQPWAGSISFYPSANWFFDPTPDTADDIPADAYDFQSFAVHEIAHVLGFTTESPVYRGFLPALEAGVDAGSVTFTGPNATKVYGGPVPFETDEVHLLSGTHSGGAPALMNRLIANGTRELPTPLDEAVLQDVGYAFVR
jgi:hypothetical protein